MTHAGSTPASRFALWDLGFRPFYLVAGIFAAISVPLWTVQYAGFLPNAWSGSMFGHAHEMLFGYALAVIAGFLFTAVRAWTGQATPTGATLEAFVLLWIGGRMLAVTSFETAATLVNAAFPIAVAVAIGIPLVRSGNRRNYLFVLLLLLLSVAAVTYQLSFLGVLNVPALASLQVGLDVVLFIIAVVGGRVIPMFTNNGIPGTRATRNAIVEKAALGGILLLLAADVLQAPPIMVAPLAFAVAAAHAARLYLWQPWRTARTPLVWILHVSYAWIIVYLALRSLAVFGMVAMPLALHALTIGAIGGMTMGMMMRTARGHTGRALKADHFELACFVLIELAALIRVLGAMLFADAYLATVIVSGICWSLAFAIFSVRYWPVLSRSRLDGKPG
ncbi:MAG: NnrS family protein [Burkholderiaceae bacterium]